MPQIDPRAQAVLAQARSGDMAGAAVAGESLVANGIADGAFRIFLGVLYGRLGDFARAIPHLQSGVEQAPDEIGAKVELGRAYLSAGNNDAAAGLAAGLAASDTPAGREMQRILARALLNLGKADAALPLFEQLTAADPQDFESWDGLGVARLATGDLAGAVEAARRSTALKPDAPIYLVHLGRSLNAASDFAAARAVAERALAGAPDDVTGWLVLARALAGLRRSDEMAVAIASARSRAEATEPLLIEIGDIEFFGRAFAASEASYAQALALDPASERGWIGVAKVLERLNRAEDLLAALDAAEAASVPPPATALLRAKALRALKRWDEALAAATLSPDDSDPVERFQLIGDIADRLGDAEASFAAFSRANHILAETTPGADDKAKAYLQSFERIRDLLTPASHARWRPVTVQSARPAPLFIFGFPRSGTTLIDTMLSGHPQAAVMEEEPTIDAVSLALGPVERIPDLGEAEVLRLINVYFAEADRYAPGAAAKLLVDKHPLGLGNTPLLHRLFPDARFVFVERHPCDVVLSCFITSARMDANVASFHSFEGTARLYDRVLAFWTRACEVLPINVHTIRYETLVADTEAQLRALADFAGLDWTPRLLDNEANAARRSYIGSPSYAQVAEPVYTRAKGRWLRYRDQMQPVIPILKPWIETMGYDL